MPFLYLIIELRVVFNPIQINEIENEIESEGQYPA